MVRLRKSLDSFDAFSEAIEGFQHYPTENLYRFLMENYTVDLDLLAEFARHLHHIQNRMRQTSDPADAVAQAA